MFLAGSISSQNLSQESANSIRIVPRKSSHKQIIHTFLSMCRLMLHKMLTNLSGPLADSVKPSKRARPIYFHAHSLHQTSPLLATVPCLPTTNHSEKLHVFCITIATYILLTLLNTMFRTPAMLAHSHASYTSPCQPPSDFNIYFVSAAAEEASSRLPKQGTVLVVPEESKPKYLHCSSFCT